MQRPSTTDSASKQSKSDFKKEFWTPRCVLSKLMSIYITHSEFICRGLRPDCSAQKDIIVLVKAIYNFGKIKYKTSAEVADNVFSDSNTMATFCLKAFSDAVGSDLHSAYLQNPTFYHIVRMKRKFSTIDLPDCIRCLDCVRL